MYLRRCRGKHPPALSKLFAGMSSQVHLLQMPDWSCRCLGCLRCQLVVPVPNSFGRWRGCREGYSTKKLWALVRNGGALFTGTPWTLCMVIKTRVMRLIDADFMLINVIWYYGSECDDWVGMRQSGGWSRCIYPSSTRLVQSYFFLLVTWLTCELCSRVIHQRLSPIHGGNAFCWLEYLVNSALESLSAPPKQFILGNIIMLWLLFSILRWREVLLGGHSQCRSMALLQKHCCRKCNAPRRMQSKWHVE